MSEENLGVITITGDEERLHARFMDLLILNEHEQVTESISRIIEIARGPFINYYKIETFLNLAISTGNLKILNTLLHHSEINVNIKCGVGHNTTALHEATSRSNLYAIERLLLFPEIDINAQDENGNTALHRASYRNKSTVTKKLLEHSYIDVNVQNKNGNTALHISSRTGEVEAIKLLLNHLKINPYLANNEGKIAGDYFVPYVLEDQKEKVIKLLEEFKEPHTRHETLEELNDDFNNINLAHSSDQSNAELAGEDPSLLDI